MAASARGFAAHPNPPVLLSPEKAARAAANVSCSTVAGVKKERNGNFYKVLSLASEKGSTLQEIKKAYRNMAQQFHPDLCPPEKREEYTMAMVEVNRAYEVLSDPVLRANHDAELQGLILEYYCMGITGARRGIMPKRTWEAQLVELERRSAGRMQRRENVRRGGAR